MAPRLLTAPLVGMLAALVAGTTPAAAMPTGYLAPPLSVKLTATPAANTHSTSAMFRWATTGTVIKTLCKVDRNVWRTCRHRHATFTGLAAGRHTFYLTIHGSGTKRVAKAFRWRVDLTAPTDPLAVTGGSTAWTAGSRTLTASGGTDAESGMAGYETHTSTDGGLSWSGAALHTGPVTFAGEGDRIVQFRSRDKAGNVSTWVPAVAGPDSTVRIDLTGPSAPAVGGDSAVWQDVPQIDLTAAGSADAASGLDHYRFQTSTDGGASWQPSVDGAAASVLDEGETLIRFRAVDAVGNESAWTVAQARIDRTDPVAPTVAGATAGWSTAASRTVTATAGADTPGSGFDHYDMEWQLDGGGWSAVATAASRTVTAEGVTDVRFRSVDSAGRTSAWVQATVQLDRTDATTPTLAGGSAAWQNATSVDVTASGSADTLSGLAGYQYQVATDGGAWSPVAAGPVATVAAEGDSDVRFRAVDDAGNTTAWVLTTVRIDRSAPGAPSLAGGGSAWQNVAGETVTASGASDAVSGVAGYEHRTSADNGVTWSAAAAGSSLTVSAEGELLVAFRALDKAGNGSGWVQRLVRIDRAAPTAPTVAGGSLAWQSIASVDLTASGSTDTGSGVTGYQHRTSTNGGGSWSAAADGATVTVSAQGETLVQFRSADAAGHHSAWTPGAATADSTVRLDRTAPTAPTVTGGNAAWQSAATVTVSADGATDAGGSGPATYQYRTSPDGGTSWSAPAAGSSTGVTAEGETLVELRAVDGAGNASAWVQATVRIDRTLPTAPTVSGGSTSWQNVASVTVTGAGATDGGSGFAGYEYRTSPDGTTWSAATAGASVTISAEGQRYVQIRSKDAAGQTSAWTPAAPTAGSTVRIDRGAPTDPTVAGGNAAWQSVASVTVSASGSTDAGSGVAGYRYQVSTNGGATWSASASGQSLTVASEGETLVRFQTFDNASPAFSSGWVQTTVRIDRTLPTLPTVSGGSTSWQLGPVTITASGGSDAGGSLLAGRQYRTSTNGGSTWSAPVAGSSITFSADGSYLVQFRSVDGAGNASASWTASAAAKVDHTAPTLPTVSGGSLTCAHKVTIRASGSTDAGSGLSGYQYRVSSNNGATWGATQTGSSVRLQSTGTYVVQFQSRDNVGTTSAWAPATNGPANTACIR
jgi:hypothetical protein